MNEGSPFLVSESVQSAMARLWTHVYPQSSGSMPDPATYANYIIADWDIMKRAKENLENKNEILEYKLEMAQMGLKLGLVFAGLMFLTALGFSIAIYFLLRLVPA